MTDTYKCEGCGGEFDKLPGADEQANEERDRLFPDLKPENSAIICDDCFRSIFGETASIH